MGPMADHLDRDAAERVLRRAVELSDTPSAADDRFDVDALLEAARDLGMDDTAIHRAVAEEQAGLLAGESPSSIDRLVGPAAVSAARVVDASLEATMGLVDDWLRRAWSFRRVRTTPTAAEYRRRTDAVASIQRASRTLAGKEQADKVKRLRVLAHPVDPTHTLVALVVDIHASRASAEAGGVTVAAVGTLGAAASGLAWVPWAWIGVPVSMAMGAGVMATRRAWTRGIDTELEAVLDRVARGEHPDSVLGGLTGRLLGGTSTTGPARPEGRY
jgi:hypothetical protein